MSTAQDLSWMPILSAHSSLENFPVENCPDSLHLTAEIGELDLPAADGAFLSLSGKRIEDDFRRSMTSSGCVLVASAPGTHSISRRQYFLIREKADGTFTLALEGYTRGGKLFSIRTASVDDDTSYDGVYDAAVYNGSGPARRKLGDATLRVEESRLGH